jgi:hypothetical protein
VMDSIDLVIELKKTIVYPTPKQQHTIQYHEQ